jgi:hypothetical protein
MITGFEKLTEELSPDERKLVPLLVSGMEKYTKQNPIKEPAIIKSLNEKIEIFGLKKKVTGVRLRKLVSFIRRKGIAPIMANSKGYFISWDKQDILDQVNSLDQRAEGILAASNGLKSFL